MASVAIQAARVVGELRTQLIYCVRTYILGFQAARGEGVSPVSCGLHGSESAGGDYAYVAMKTWGRGWGRGNAMWSLS